MRHRFLTILFSVGLVSGLAFGISGCCHHRHHQRAALEAHVADVCVQAAERMHREKNKP